MSSALRGKPEVVRMAMVALTAGGHLLVEDVPGVGKTTLARAMARSIGGSFHRIQFTSDLLPSDVTGVSIWDPGSAAFVFREGPIFSNILLADEINRSGPRTQSALLEAMNEATVTIDNQTRQLPEPFMVIATQNPIEHHGTYPLPDSELDRFLLRVHLGYPSRDAEKQLVLDRRVTDPLDLLQPRLSSAKVLDLCQQCRQVQVKDPIMEYLLAIVDATRSHPAVEIGVSPRGSLMLFRAAQAQAFIEGRGYIIPDDVKALAGPVLAHRLVLRAPDGRGPSLSEELIKEIASRVAVPV